MDLQMQLKRALIAFAVWAALGGIALSRAGAETPASARSADAEAPVLVHAGAEAHCRSHLRIDLTDLLRVTLPCDRNCSPVRAIAHALSLPVTTRLDACELRQA